MCGVTSAALTLGVVDEDQEPERCTNHSTGVQVLKNYFPNTEQVEPTWRNEQQTLACDYGQHLERKRQLNLIM